MTLSPLSPQPQHRHARRAFALLAASATSPLAAASLQLQAGLGYDDNLNLARDGGTARESFALQAQAVVTGRLALSPNLHWRPVLAVDASQPSRYQALGQVRGSVGSEWRWRLGPELAAPTYSFLLEGAVLRSASSLRQHEGLRLLVSRSQALSPAWEWQSRAEASRHWARAQAFNGDHLALGAGLRYQPSTRWQLSGSAEWRQGSFTSTAAIAPTAGREVVADDAFAAGEQSFRQRGAGWLWQLDYQQQVAADWRWGLRLRQVQIEADAGPRYQRHQVLLSLRRHWRG